MNDLISRQAAIDALDKQIEQCNRALGAFYISLKDEYAIKVERASLKAYKEQLENLPSAQPATNCSEFPNNSDTISRQAAIDAISKIKRTDNWQAAVSMALLDLPSAQPEIIRCKDCRHNHDCNIQYHAQAGEEFYCGVAERRIDGKNQN